MTEICEIGKNICECDNQSGERGYILLSYCCLEIAFFQSHLLTTERPTASLTVVRGVKQFHHHFSHTCSVALPKI